VEKSAIKKLNGLGTTSGRWLTGCAVNLGEGPFFQQQAAQNAQPLAAKAK